MSDSFDWAAFLRDFNRELLANLDPGSTTAAEVGPDGWLVFPPASEEAIAAAEARLGVTLPSSYRAFLRVSNGWRGTGTLAGRVLPVAEVRPFAVAHAAWLAAHREGAAYYAHAYGAPAGEDPLDRALGSSLAISGVGDNAIYLLTPDYPTGGGEYGAWLFATWAPGDLPHPSFRRLMEHERTIFRRLRADGSTWSPWEDAGG